MMKLLAGQRFSIDDNSSYILVVSGKVEAYAVTTNKSSFRQTFLINIEAGQAAFPALDKFKKINIILYAVEDSELEKQYFDNSSIDNLKPLMSLWLKNLTNISWIANLANHGDDVILSWSKSNLFEKSNSIKDLLNIFTDNEKIND